jgi:hypothetical protein
MHRLLTDLVAAGRTRITSRLDGLVLAGDGDNAVGLRGAVRLRLAKRTGVNRALHLGSARASRLVVDRVLMCDRFDVVCDTGSVITAGALGGPVVVGAAGVGIRAHTRYYPAHAGLKTAGSRIGARINSHYPVHVVFVKRTGVLVPGRTWTLRVPDLRGASDKAAALFKQQVNAWINTNLAWARYGSDCPASGKYMGNDWVPATASVVGHRVVSVAMPILTNSNCGGPNGNAVRSITVDTKTATLQKLSSYVVANGHQLRWEVVKTLKATNECVWPDLTASPYPHDGIDLPAITDWTVSAAGVTFWFDRYDVRRACGVMRTTVPWASLLRPGDIRAGGHLVPQQRWPVPGRQQARRAGMGLPHHGCRPGRWQVLQPGPDGRWWGGLRDDDDDTHSPGTQSRYRSQLDPDYSAAAPFRCAFGVHAVLVRRRQLLGPRTRDVAMCWCQRPAATDREQGLDLSDPR